MNPSDDQHDANEWDAQRLIARHHALHQAARFLWFIGALQVVVFGWMTVSIIQLAGQSPDQLRIVLHKLPPHQIDLIIANRALFTPTAGMVALLGVLPGIAYIVLGFLVRSAQVNGINFALLIVLTQGIVVGVMLLWSVLSAVVGLDPSGLTLAVLLLGTPTALLGYAGHLLLRARQVSETDDSIEPWDRDTP